jgi:RecB family exonuclease
LSDSLKEVLAASGPAPKILVVPSPQAGRKIVTSWARRGIATLGLQALTPGKLADMVLEEAFPAQAVTPLRDMNQVLGLDALLRTFNFRKLEALGWSGQQLAKSIRAMRLSGLAPDEYKAQIPRKLGRNVSEVYDAYLKWLYSTGTTDEAERFVRAEFALGKVQTPTLLMVMGETPISESARIFLEAMALKVESHVVVGSETAQAAGTAGTAFAEWAFVAEPARKAATIDLVRVPAVEDEARFVLDEVQTRGLPLDTVEIAYPRHTPYLPMFLGETASRGMAATSAAGTPLSDLPVGQAMRLFLEWLAAGQDSTALVRLLRSGFVKLPDSVPAQRVISNLIEVHVVGSRLLYRRAFQGLRRLAQAEADQAEGTERQQGARQRIKSLQKAERAVDRLFDYVPVPDETLRGFAERLRKFVETLVPETEDLESTAGKGRAEMISRLAQIEEGPDSAHPSAHLVGRFRDWLPTIIVHARVDAPGALHIVPLDSAGLAGRENLFVVGLDSGNFLPSPVEDVFLPDDFCEAYQRISGPLTSEERVERRRHALRQALARTSGTACVVVAEGRIADDSSAGPASTFIELEAEHGRARQARPAQAEGAAKAVLEYRTTALGTQLLDRFFPAMARGRHAAAERASTDFTGYDGFVGVRETVTSALGEPLSPSKLQVLATCPFQFFQKQILGIPVLEERRPGQWMTPLENGSLVHDALSTFNHEVMEGAAAPTDTGRLESLLVGAFKAFRKANEPPSEYVWRARMRELARIAQVVTAPEREVVTAELGFGMMPWRAEGDQDHTGDFRLALGDTSILLRGRIDVVERTPRGLVITDYKTGRSDDYNEKDLLDSGKRLQWVLYAYAYEDMRGEAVDESGYLFVSGDTAGRTTYGRPPSRDEIGELLGGYLNLAKQGSFGASVDPNNHCKWCDFRRVCGDLRSRRGEIQAKLDGLSEPNAGGDGQPASQPAEAAKGWTYAEKYLSRKRK